MNEEKVQNLQETVAESKGNKTKILFIVMIPVVLVVIVLIGILIKIIPLPNFIQTPSTTNGTDVVEQQVQDEIPNDVDLPYARCPIDDEVGCKAGRIINNGEEYYGAGYAVLPAETKIIAVVSGEVEVEENGDVTIVNISNPAQKVTYEFIGHLTLPEGTTSIAEGEEIGEIISSSQRVRENYILTVSFYLLITNQYSKFRISSTDGSYVKKRIE